MVEYHVNTRWLHGATTPEAKEKVRLLVMNGAPILELLGTILVSEIEELSKTSSEDYDNPNWALREADRKGQIRFARKMLELTKRTPNAR
jgi:hypothetical protein